MWCVLIRILGIVVCIIWCVLNRTTSHPNRNTSLSRVSSISQEQGNSRSGPETFVASEIFSVSVQYFGLQYFLCTWAVLVDIYYNKVQCVYIVHKINVLTKQRYQMATNKVEFGPQVRSHALTKSFCVYGITYNSQTG